MQEPTGDECENNAQVWRDGELYYACWYPQMGGYGGKCLVAALDTPDECFEAFVWHDGEFPFGDRWEGPVNIHHCSADQFVDFGEKVKTFLKGGGEINDERDLALRLQKIAAQSAGGDEK